MNRVKSAVCVLVFCGIAVSAGACSAISEDGQWQDSGVADEAVSQQTQALTGAHKLCSVYAPSNWRDTIVVDNGWTKSTCANFGASVGATMMNVGCLSDTGSVFGSAIAVSHPNNAGTPSPNCGW